MRAMISAVIPAYNASDTIRKCIDSVLSQDYPDDRIEVIIVNDGSADDTLDIILNYKQRDSRVKVINQKNMGPAGARDSGLKAATGDIVSLLSSDTYASKDWFESLYKAFSADSKIGIVQGMILPYKDINVPIYHMYILKRQVWNYPTAAIAYRAPAVDEAGRYFDIELSHYGDDTDLAWRILGKGYSARWLPKVTAYHDVVPKTFWGTIKSAKNAHKIPLLFKKRPELRANIKMGFLYSSIWELLNISLIFILPFMFFNYLYFAIVALSCITLTLLRSVKVSFYNKCNPVHKITTIPLNMIMCDMVTFLALIYGSIKHRNLII